MLWCRRSTTQGGLTERAWYLSVRALGLTLCSRRTVTSWREGIDHERRGTSDDTGDGLHRRLRQARRTSSRGERRYGASTRTHLGTPRSYARDAEEPDGQR